MDHKTLGDIFQEIVVELSEMKPIELDELENEVKAVLRRLGECLMEWMMSSHLFGEMVRHSYMVSAANMHPRAYWIITTYVRKSRNVYLL